MDKIIDKKKYDVDHFILWSFVMNDELWNLSPMESSLNSSKSNRLPNWDDFFIRFAKNQYIMYEKIHEKEQRFTAAFRQRARKKKGTASPRSLTRYGNTSASGMISFRRANMSMRVYPAQKNSVMSCKGCLMMSGPER